MGVGNFFQIPNSIFEYKIYSKLTKNELVVTDLIIRLTYGIERSKSHLSCFVEPIDIANITGIKIQSIAPILESLQEKHLILWKRESGLIKFRNDFTQWPLRKHSSDTLIMVLKNNLELPKRAFIDALNGKHEVTETVSQFLESPTESKYSIKDSKYKDNIFSPDKAIEILRDKFKFPT